MRTQRYSLAELFEDKELEQFIIPEIQRDYVWENNDVTDLLEYIKEGFEGGKEDKPYLGFVYAYNDRDYAYKYFLIDGQQRLTTIFLLLIAGNIKLGKGLPEYLIEQYKLKIDYKVRQSTHDFFTDLVNFCADDLRNPDFSITDQMWYHDEYSNDRSIQNIISNFDCIRKWLNSVTDLTGFVKFIEDKVDVSYYHVEDGRQGEDLYIYMNSRGRQLEPNETLKAKYLSKVTDKSLWGAEWELWQDFFWKHRLQRADADEGFNDFLRMVQVIMMARQNNTSDEISNFARGRGDQILSVNKLPAQIEELKDLYDAFEWLVKTESFSAFFKKYENENYLITTPPYDRAQIFYFRILPVLTFVGYTKCRDENAVFRFLRFFYNVSRKSSSVGKDIGGQLPIAIRLMQEYAESKDDDFDVCELIGFSQRRTVILDEEEIIKLSLFAFPPEKVTRVDLEKLFWAIEDHPVFDGEIEFFLKQYYDVKKEKLNHTKLVKTWKIFASLFTGNKINNYELILALLQYGNTWIRETPFYYINYNCINWFELVRTENGKYLMLLLEDLSLHRWPNLAAIIEVKSGNYFETRNYQTIPAIKAEQDLYKQVKVLAILDYFSDKKMYHDGNFYIANDSRFDYKDNSFYDNKVVIHNVKRYIDSGQHGRVVPMLSGILQNSERLEAVIQNILTKKA